MESAAFKIREALLKVGVSVYDIWDLVNSGKSYQKAIPVLIELLDMEMDDRSKECIIRALAVKEAKGKIGNLLVKEFNKTPNAKMFLKWAIGNTMEVVITDSDLDSVLDIVMNKENGRAREMFVLALGKIKSEKSEKALISLLDDDEVVRHALSALGKLKALSAKKRIGELLYHPNTIVRKNAQMILDKMK